MNPSQLQSSIDGYLANEMTEADFLALQDELKRNPDARRVFRERMDLEASLHTWATEETLPVEPARLVSPRRGRWPIALAVAVAMVLFAWAGFAWLQPDNTPSQPATLVSPSNPTSFGTLHQSDDCAWRGANRSTLQRFSQGTFALVSGVAELRFDTGTNLVLEGPCKLRVAADASAQLIEGNLVVRVSELSDGFTLHTPDAVILDRASEYAVSLNDSATEVYVFDGSVTWQPTDTDGQQIDKGEARRYPRAQPHRGTHIPFDQRQFVRRIEERVRQQGGEALLAYDGFENLAGRVRRGRSGFGWTDGWKPVGRGRGNIANIVDTPDDVVFGFARQGRRQLSLTNGQDIQREFAQPVTLEPGHVYYLSCLIQRQATSDNQKGHLVQLSLLDTKWRGRQTRRGIAFGVASDDRPFLKMGGRIQQSANRIEPTAVAFCVAKILVDDVGRVETSLRVYDPNEPIDVREPSAWTTVAKAFPRHREYTGARLTVGPAGDWLVDELKLGTTWASVATMGEVER